MNPRIFLYKFDDDACEINDRINEEQSKILKARNLRMEKKKEKQ